MCFIVKKTENKYNVMFWCVTVSGNGIFIFLTRDITLDITFQMDIFCFDV